MSSTELAWFLEAVDVQHDEACNPGKVEEADNIVAAEIGIERENSMDNAGTPTNHGEEKNDIEFLMNIDRKILVICVYSNARRGVNRVVSLGAHLKLYF